MGRTRAPQATLLESVSQALWETLLVPGLAGVGWVPIPMPGLARVGWGEPKVAIVPPGANAWIGIALASCLDWQEADMPGLALSGGGSRHRVPMPGLA